MPPPPTDSVDHIDAMFAAAGVHHGSRRTRGTGKQKVVAQKRSRAEPPAASPLEVVQVPSWREIPGLIHGFSTRTGGTSTAYSLDRASGELNLGYTDSDARANTDRNRRLLLREVGASRLRLVTLRQVHSGLIHCVTAKDATGVDGLRGDGLVTGEPGLVLAIQTADCVPVLILDTVNRAVGAFHAGWRGTVRRIVERGVGLMRAQFGSDPLHLQAAIGPAIGPCCYSVGEELVHEFHSQFAYSTGLFREVYDADPVKMKYPMLFLTARAPGHSEIGPQTHLDLPEANRRQLLDAGLAEANIWSSGECTACNPQKYFSHRGEHGFTGRMLSVIGLRRGLQS